MGFLGALADQISSQFSLGENTNHTLDAVNPDTGKLEKYGSLGDFASKFDQSAERRYVEEGYLRKDPYNTDPKQFEVLFQEPNATVLIKKKMFSSVSDNFRPDFMDKDEKLYYKAMKVLFQNKCAQIAALEKLSKIERISSAMGSFPNQLVPILLSTADQFNASLTGGSNLFGALSPLTKSASNLNQALDKIRRFHAFNITSPHTKWITDSTNLFQSQWGQGTGTIEITNFTSLSTNVTTDINSSGGFTLSISDPYEAMLITEFDIEKAISDATNMFYNNKVTQFAKESAENLINDITGRLNHIRSVRGAGPITLKLDPDTMLGKRITAILDRAGIEIPFTYDSSSLESIVSGGAFGGGVSIPPEYLRGGEIAKSEGLDPQKVSYKYINSKRKHQGPDSEVSLFERLVSTIYSQQSLAANSRNAFQTLNKDTNYARKKLRFNFSGKLIIQPMDVVHIYINSKSRYDTKLLSGLQGMFSGLGMLQNLNNTLTGLKNAVDTVFNPSGSVPFQVEKSSFVGHDFPNYLWATVRGSFTTENEGTHVFGGVVENAVDNWSNGKYTIDVSGKDNTIYFEQGKVNFKPGVDNFNGAIFDPLTPFRSEFDTIDSHAKEKTPSLLLENQSLLGLNDSTISKFRKSMLKHKLGRFVGQPVTACNLYQDVSLDPVTGRVVKIFYAPDGLVYKWKEGIGVFTQFGSNLEMNSASKVGNPNIAKEPFAGQDVMNVLSLLITGLPYNFMTYFKAAQNFDALGVDPSNKQSTASAFAMSLKNELTKNNTLWGNFIPFKNLVIDESSYVKALSTQTSILEKNAILESQIAKLSDLNHQIIMFGAVNVMASEPRLGVLGGIGNTGFFKIRKQIEKLQIEIEETKKQIQNSNTKFEKTGIDTSFDAAEFIDPQKIGASKSDAALRRMLRRQLNYLTRRMSYNVRANEDKNLFIVDDFYDKDMDIMAYEQSLTDGIKLYNNEFTSVKEKIAMTANLLNLEVFCDTQGHIRCRPPQYNRMPSSVFYRMMFLKQSLNIQVFPQFLDDLFNTKLDTIKTRLEIIEDQIRLDCAILGNKETMSSDDDAVQFILSNNPAGGSFSFISNPLSGAITQIQDLLIAANPDQSAKANPQSLEEFTKIKSTATSTKEPFGVIQKYDTINDYLDVQYITKNGLPINGASPFSTVVDDLVKRIHGKSGQKIDTSDYLIKDAGGNYNVAVPIGLQVDPFKVIGEIAAKIAERQKVLRLFFNTIKNAQEFKSLDDNGDNTGNQMLTPGLFGKSEIPEVFEHMIEDETYDDYGPGSGTRFIIKRAQIRSLSIAENPPPWTSVEVHGIMNPYAPNAVPPGLNSFPGGGNGLVTALAIDYDMWRNYGFKQAAVIPAPFLSDPVTQCGPYASMLLSRNRKNILRGTCTISGNEFMQPGEVVFLEDRQLLFYVASVKHNFTFGNNFTTTLELTYGHTPGEYIPTVMDMVGKMIYNNKDLAEMVVQRQDTSATEVNVGVLQLAPNTKSYDPGQSLGLGADSTAPPSTWAAANSQVINNILYVSAPQIASSNSHLELRIYYDDKNPINSDLQNFANYARQILIGQNMAGLNSITVTKQGLEATPLQKESVKELSETSVSLDDYDDRRSPSQAALSAARNQSGAGQGMAGGGFGAALSDIISPITGAKTKDKVDDGANQSSADIDKLKTSLFKYIVDCWIVNDS